MIKIFISSFVIVCIAGCTNPFQAPPTYQIEKPSASDQSLREKDLRPQETFNHRNDILSSQYSAHPFLEGSKKESDIIQADNLKMHFLSITKHKSHNKEHIRTSNVPLAKISSRKGNDNTNENIHNSDSYIVQTHDTLYSISQKFNVPLRETIAINQLQPPYNLRIGQRLILKHARYYLVKPHDTIYSIAHMYNVSVGSLVEQNHIHSPFKITIGSRLKIPESIVLWKKNVTHTLTTPHRLNNPQHEGRNLFSQNSPLPITKPLIALPVRSSRYFLWPVHGKTLIAFGRYDHGVLEKGIRITAPSGTPVRAAENGIVVYDGDYILGFRHLILIQHADHYLTAYAHVHNSIVHRGEFVRRGQRIGTIGRIDSSKIPQIDFQIRKGLRILNPILHLAR